MRTQASIFHDKPFLKTLLSEAGVSGIHSIGFDDFCALRFPHPDLHPEPGEASGLALLSRFLGVPQDHAISRLQDPDHQLLIYYALGDDPHTGETEIPCAPHLIGRLSGGWGKTPEFLLADFLADVELVVILKAFGPKRLQMLKLQHGFDMSDDDIGWILKMKPSDVSETLRHCNRVLSFFRLHSVF